MLTEMDAAKIGINVCIDRIGRAFVQKYSDSATSAYGKTDEGMFCFVGVDDHPKNVWLDSTITLSDERKNEFPYRVSCIVSLEDGQYKLIDDVIPAK